MTNSSGWSHLLDIESSSSTLLQGRTIALAISGSVAALESFRLARALIRHGAKVRCLLTPAAKQLVSATSLEWATGFPVVTELTGRCEHLELFGEHGTADLLLLAPATANTVGKLALGLDDNAVTTTALTALGSKVPVLCCPGMHEPMMASPAVAENLSRLSGFGVELLMPSVSEGKAKMMGVEEVVSRVLRRLGPNDLAGQRVLITGGPTREYLDPARCFTNPSSGASACFLAEEAERRGAKAVLVYGPGQASPAPWLDVRLVETGEDMVKAVELVLEEGPVSYALSVAAVADFAPTERAEQKISTAGLQELTVKLVPTPKILDLIRARAPNATLVAFKASSQASDEAMENEAKGYLDSGRADWVVANPIASPGLGFESLRNRYLVVGPNTQAKGLGPAEKSSLAIELWEHLLGS